MDAGYDGNVGVGVGVGAAAAAAAGAGAADIDVEVDAGKGTRCLLGSSRGYIFLFEGTREQRSTGRQISAETSSRKQHLQSQLVSVRDEDEGDWGQKKPSAAFHCTVVWLFYYCMCVNNYAVSTLHCNCQSQQAVNSDTSFVVCVTLAKAALLSHD
ncbi:hypothetical protein GQ42DRAFT_180930 [Ramicandelaber brevisporus]|nr:hypothetical protein GQ42DRAFT_180930 [Ramicandelaber brevisporus]